MEGGTSLLDELLAKHQNSAQPESRQLVAVAGAVAEVLAAEGMQPTPTALFAAAMSSLERTEAQGSPEARHSAWPDDRPCAPPHSRPYLVPCGSTLHTASALAAPARWQRASVPARRLVLESHASTIFNRRLAARARC